MVGLRCVGDDGKGDYEGGGESSDVVCDEGGDQDVGVMKDCFDAV